MRSSVGRSVQENWVSTNTDMGSNQGSKIRLGCGSNLNDGPPAFVCDFDFVCLFGLQEYRKRLCLRVVLFSVFFWCSKLMMSAHLLFVTTIDVYDVAGGGGRAQTTASSETGT